MLLTANKCIELIKKSQIFEILFWPKNRPKGQLGAGIGPFGLKNHEESASGLKNPKNPPKNKDPTDKIFLKPKFEDLFKNISISINFQTETIPNLKKKILDKETIIGDYYTARVFSSDDKQSLNENKDKRGDTFIFLVIGGLLTTLFLRFDFFAAPPELPGSIS